MKHVWHNWNNKLTQSERDTVKLWVFFGALVVIGLFSAIIS